jgi:hypothetical protein
MCVANSITFFDILIFEIVDLLDIAPAHAPDAGLHELAGDRGRRRFRHELPELLDLGPGVDFMN